MRAWRKDQAGAFALEGSIVGEAKLVERGFAVGIRVSLVRGQCLDNIFMERL